MGNSVRIVVGAAILSLRVNAQIGISRAGEVKAACAAGFRPAVDDLGPKLERGSGHKRAVRLAASVLASMLLFAAVAYGAEIRVMISGGFSAAYLALVPEFERTTGHSLVTSRGPSIGTTPSSIPSRLQRGEPVDLFLMAGDGLEELNKQGKVAAGTRVDLARSSIGMAVRAGAPKPDIGTVDAFKRVMLDAESVAISMFALGVYFSEELFPGRWMLRSPG